MNHGAAGAWDIFNSVVEWEWAVGCQFNLPNATRAHASIRFKN